MPTKVGIMAKHKSNLFSINVFNSGLDDEYLEKNAIGKSGHNAAAQRNLVA